MSETEPPLAPPRLAEGLTVAAGIARVAGCYAALAATLLFVRGHINQALAAVARVTPMPAMRMDIVCWRTEPPTQSRSYVILLAFVAAAALLHALVLWLLRRWPLAVLSLETGIVGVACAMAFRASPFLGRAFLLGIVPISALLAPYSLPSRQPAPRLASAATTASLALQSIPLAWGAWITTFTLPIGAIVGTQIAVWSFSVWRATVRTRPEDEVLAGLPLTLLPVVGLLREPRLAWLAGALAAYAALKAALRSNVSMALLVRRARATVSDVVVVASFLGACAVFTIPYRFRDLPRLNHNSHETGAYATVNSILHGKLMMADAGLIYGPLRSYALTLYALVAGMTAEQIRLGQALMNHVVLAIMLAVGWRLVHRRLAAMVWYVYLLLVGSLVLDWVNYAGVNAFGWADLGRIGLPFLATVGGLAALFDATGDGAFTRRSAMKLAAWGALAAVATLWAQEFGACAIIALASVPFVHFLYTSGSLRERARLAGLTVASFMGGTLATLGLYVGIYALHGKARLFLSTVTAQSAAFTSGSYGAFVFPANEGSFLNWSGLIAPAGHEGYALEYAAPVGIYVFAMMALGARAFSSRWTRRDTMTLGVLVFGLASFRFALGRSDYIHLATVTLPAVALLPRLSVEAVRAIYASRTATQVLRLIAAGAAVGLALATLNITGIHLALGPRLNNILSGYERPSSGPAYVYPNIARAGDVRITPDYVALVEAIRANSAPTDKIFQHIGYMDGGEVYFLADRANPTRYDILAEFLTTDRQQIALDELQRDPPKLEVGEDWGMVGPEIMQFWKDHYHSIGKFGGFDLLMRNE